MAPITGIINISMGTSTFHQNFKKAHVRPLLKNISSQSTAISYNIKITIYLIHYNQPTGYIILQNHLHWKYIKISLLVWTGVMLQLWSCLTCPPLSTPLTMLHLQIDFQIGMEYLGRPKFDLLIIWKIRTNMYKWKANCQTKSHSHMEFHGALSWDLCFLPYTLHHSGLLSPFLT